MQLFTLMAVFVAIGSLWISQESRGFARLAWSSATLVWAGIAGSEIFKLLM